MLESRVPEGEALVRKGSKLFTFVAVQGPIFEPQVQTVRFPAALDLSGSLNPMARRPTVI